MQIDQTTLSDLAIFSSNEEESIMHLLDYTRTVGGRSWLRFFVKNTLEDIDEILAVQNIIKKLIAQKQFIPDTITNGTMMVLDKYYESPVSSLPQRAGNFETFLYTIINHAEYSLARYSIQHIFTFIQGMYELTDVLYDEDEKTDLQRLLHRATLILQKPIYKKIKALPPGRKHKPRMIVEAGYYFYKSKHEIKELETIYYKIDAWLSMAVACERHNFIFPEITESASPYIIATNLWHPMLRAPVGYHFSITKENNFMFLTGANMAGKSTFIRAIGIAVYLANIGMAVPAEKLMLSRFDGLLSNIDISDNTLKGESYFYNEVQRINKTIDKITDGKHWLILIDELFKGTNIQDAMRCSIVVIEGFRKISNALFILSTHLYEIGTDLQKYTNIQFKYFETAVAADDTLTFSYHLKDGISNDRLGYLILRREGAVDKLKQL